MTIIIDFPGIPKAKERPRFSRRSRRPYTPPQTAAYEQSLGWASKLAMKGKAPLQGSLAVSVDAHFPVPQSWSKRDRAAALIGEIRPKGKPDSDNLLKTAGDALNGIVWLDDAQIVDADIHKYYSVKPLLHIEVTEL